MTGYEPIDAAAFDIKNSYNWINAHHSRFFYVLCTDSVAYFKNAIKSVNLIVAAGGLVKNERGEYLFIFRNEKWDLPKGKIEKGEKVKETAVREVEEECGIKVSKLKEKICKTFHVYIYRGDIVLKKTHWFNMRCSGQNKLKPQVEEGITDAQWFNKSDITTITQNTFSSIMDVLIKQKLIKGKPALLSE